MQTAFPATIRVPRGLVKRRLPWGIPPKLWFLLVVIAVVPIALMGTWYPLLATLPLGGFIAFHAARDPDFLRKWFGELRFQKRYR